MSNLEDDRAYAYPDLFPVRIDPKSVGYVLLPKWMYKRVPVPLDGSEGIAQHGSNSRSNHPNSDR